MTVKMLPGSACVRQTSQVQTGFSGDFHTNQGSNQRSSFHERIKDLNELKNAVARFAFHSTLLIASSTRLRNTFKLSPTLRVSPRIVIRQFSPSTRVGERTQPYKRITTMITRLWRATLNSDSAPPTTRVHHFVMFIYALVICHYLARLWRSQRSSLHTILSEAHR